MGPAAVRTIAIIGAGPSGLAAAKQLAAEKIFTKIDIFEQRSATGGVWNHSALDAEPGFSIPRQTPINQPDSYTTDTAGVQFVSPVYDNLETNLTHGIMGFSDHTFPSGTMLFPRHEEVLQYLRLYGKELEDQISFQKQVIRVEKIRTAEKPKWDVKVKDLLTDEVLTFEYDAVMVASGHYSEPFLPAIQGIEEFNQQFPAIISHAKYYRRPEQHKGKKVIVVGNSASAIDISNQISEHAALPVIISIKDDEYAFNPESSNSWSTRSPQIEEFLPAHRGVRFSNGHVEHDIDSVIFCTGYHYIFPFLKQPDNPVFVPSGAYADHLWHHMLYTKDPTLAFLCIPQQIAPFPFGEGQAAVIARMWSGRLETPSTEEMDQWVDNLRAAKGDAKARHLLGTPGNIAYTNMFYDMCSKATPRPELGLENHGVGKLPIYWDEEMSWIRLMTLNIKLAMRALGERRREVTTLKQLGFDFETWKSQQR